MLQTLPLAMVPVGTDKELAKYQGMSPTDADGLMEGLTLTDRLRDSDGDRLRDKLGLILIDNDADRLGDIEGEIEADGLALGEIETLRLGEMETEID